MLALKRFCMGYLRVALTGDSMERFLNLCTARKLTVWNVCSNSNGCQFSVLVRDFKHMKPLVHKAQVHLSVLGRYGLPFFLYKNRRRKAYAAGMLLFFGILLLLSEFIWKIQWEGNWRLTEDELMDYLSQQNVHYGMWKRRVDCDDLERALRSDYPEITWVSAGISGTQLVIRIRENEVMGELPEKDETPCNLVSDRDGVITRMMVRSGTACTGPGEEIRKGQLLVSGTIPIIDDFGETIRCQETRADADVWAKTQEHYTENLPLLVQTRSYTGRKRYGLRLKIGNISILFLCPKTGKQSWEYQKEVRQLVFFKDFYVPVWYEWILARECSCYERNWTKEELQQKMLKINQQKICNLQKKGVQIIENNVRILDKHSYWEINGSFVLEEPIGVWQNINQAEEID